MARRTASTLVICTAVGLWALLVASPGAFAAVRYAAPSGSGPGASCPQANPCDIQTAVEDASIDPGDEVVVLPGTYTLGADSLIAPFDLNVHGAAGQPRPQLDSTASTAVIARGQIADLGITGSGAVVLQAAGASPIVERVLVHATGSGGQACLGLGTTNLFRNLVCWADASGGIGYFSSGSGSVSRTTTLRGVTAVGAGTGIGVGAFQGGTSITVDAQNVIASGATADASSFTDSSGAFGTVTLDFSNYDTQSETGTNSTVTDPGTASNQTAAPMFANAGAGNFHQLFGSITRNSGSGTATLTGSSDLDREPRSQEAAPDIGADEYDVLAPDTQVTGGPSGPTSDATPTFSFSSDDVFSTFMCAVDGGTFAFGPCSGPAASHTPGPLADGPHTFRVEAIDVSGNADPSPAQRTLTVDTKAPETKIGKGPGRKTKKRKAVLAFSSNESGVTFECLFGTKAFLPCTSPATYRKLKPGSHVFKVRAKDAAGNVDPTPVAKSWRVTKGR